MLSTLPAQNRRRRSRRPLTVKVEVGVLCWWADNN